MLGVASVSIVPLTVAIARVLETFSSDLPNDDEMAAINLRVAIGRVVLEMGA